MSKVWFRDNLTGKMREVGIFIHAVNEIAKPTVPLKLQACQFSMNHFRKLIDHMYNHQVEPWTQAAMLHHMLMLAQL